MSYSFDTILGDGFLVEVTYSLSTEGETDIDDVTSAETGESLLSLIIDTDLFDTALDRAIAHKPDVEDNSPCEFFHPNPNATKL